MIVKIIIILILNICYIQATFSNSKEKEIYKDYFNLEYEKAIEKAYKLRESDEKLYLLGLLYTKLGNYPQARQYLNRLTEKFHYSKFYQQAFLKFIETYYLEGNFSKAKELYESIKDKEKFSDFLPFIYLRLAKLYQVEGNWFDSKKYFSLLREKFPESIEVNIISPIEEEIDFFTVQVGAFREKENAQALRDQLSKDFPVYILEDIKKGYPLYKVRVGKFKDKTQAQRVYYQLIRKGYPAKIYP